MGYLWQTKIESLEEAFVSTASKYKIPRSWPYEKNVFAKESFQAEIDCKSLKDMLVKVKIWKKAKVHRNRKPRGESAQACQ